MEDLENGRLKAIERENVEAEAAAVAGGSISKEIDRVLTEHSDRIKGLREEMNVRPNFTTFLYVSARFSAHAGLSDALPWLDSLPPPLRLSPYFMRLSLCS